MPPLNTQGHNRMYTESIELPSQRTTSRKLLGLVFLQHQQHHIQQQLQVKPQRQQQQHHLKQRHQLRQHLQPDFQQQPHFLQQPHFQQQPQYLPLHLSRFLSLAIHL